MPNNWHERALGYRFKQPTADKEETRQTKKDKHSIITHSGITKAEIAYMRKNHENHRKSPHGINIFYSLIHFQNSAKKVIFENKIWPLTYQYYV